MSGDVPGFSSSFLSLPPELQSRIFLYLAPDDLSVLSRSVDALKDVDQDEFLRKMWFEQTAPARVEFALFSPLKLRPDPDELFRLGILRGVAIVNGIRNRSYWGSPDAVRISRLHHKFQLNLLRNHLSQALSPKRRPTTADLYTSHILPTSSLLTSPTISAGVHALQKAKDKDEIRRALKGIVGKTLKDVLAEGGDLGRLLGTLENGEGARVRWAVCPGIKDKKRFWEDLATAGG